MKNTSFVVILIFLIKVVIGQTPFSTNAIIPPSPNVASIFKFVETPVSRYSGLPEVSVPVYTISGESIEIPITISYHAGGIRVTEASSWVGMGWALNAGGIIMQSIRGIRDDTEHGRFNTTPFSMEYLDDLTACDLKMVTDNLVDSEPDIFSFTFNGKNGKFYFDNDQHIVQIEEQKIKIEANPQGTSPISTIFSWRITDIDGTQYFFDALETHLSWTKTVRGPEVLGQEDMSNHPEVSQRSWMLTKIKQLNGEVVTFNYETYSYLDYAFGSETQNFPEIPGYDQACGSDPLPYFVTTAKNFQRQSTESGKRLQSIVFSEGRIEFVPGLNRCDLFNDRFLDKIVVFNSNDKKLKELDLTYKYFVGNTSYTVAQIDCSNDDGPDLEMAGSNYHNNYKDRRLFLTSVDEVDVNGVNIGTYTFEYENGLGLPDRFSAEQDWWGFYNGNGQTSLLENLYKTDQLLDGVSRYDIYGRDPDLLYAKQGSMKKIIYPTGGYTAFEFELNSLTTSYGPTKIVHPEVNYSASGPTTDTFLGNITVNDISGSADIPFEVEKCTFGGNSNSLVGFYITDMSNNVVVSGAQVLASLQSNPYGEIEFTLNTGQYKIYSYAQYPFQCTYNIKIKKWRDQPPFADNKDNGGLKIKKITNYDPVSDKMTYKTFDYTKFENGKYVSSGVSSLPVSSVRNDYIFWQSVCVLYNSYPPYQAM